MFRLPHAHRPAPKEPVERIVNTIGVIALYVLIMMAVLLVISLATKSAAGGDPMEPMPMPVVIMSPWDGEFHASEYPGAPPFVQIGSEVTSETVVGMVDAMKLLPVKAGVAGTITDVLVTDGEMVEAGQPLFVVRPPLPPI